jgi:hypothetical protein
MMVPAQVLMNGLNNSRTAGAIAGLFYFLPVCFLLAYFIRAASREAPGFRKVGITTATPAT